METKIVTFICPTEGCENYGIPIDLEVDADCTRFVCGPCGQRIEVEND